METSKITAIFIYGRIENSNDYNIDVSIEVNNQISYSCTFFTIKNVISIMENNKNTEEDNREVYFWSMDMCIIDILSYEKIILASESLLNKGHLNHFSASNYVNNYDGKILNEDNHIMRIY